MTLVAAISQPMRAAHCAAYVTNCETDRIVVLTSNAPAFASVELGQNVEVVSLTPPVEILPTGRLIGGRLSRRVRNWAREGSHLGMRVERLVKSLVWKLRYLDRAVLLTRRARRRGPLTESVVRDSPLVSEFRRIHDENPIDRIVVFDLFDLPGALIFAKDHDVEVLVR